MRWVSEIEPIEKQIKPLSLYLQLRKISDQTNCLHKENNKSDNDEFAAQIWQIFPVIVLTGVIAENCQPTMILLQCQEFCKHLLGAYQMPMIPC